MCARESFLATPANQICCPSGRVGDVCRNQTADQPCRTNDALCASDVCVAGVCLAAKQPQLAVCESDTDCSNGVCAKANLAATGPQICCPCPDGTPKLDLSDQVNDVCRNQTVGQPCGLRNSLCASGVCVAGACLASKQLQLAPCESDPDCLNGVCGRESYTATANTICCPDGTSKVANADFFGDTDDVCRNQLLGQPCGTNDDLCESGICFVGTCKSSIYRGRLVRARNTQ